MTTELICLTHAEIKNLLIILNNVCTCHDLPKTCDTYKIAQQLITEIKTQTGEDV